MQKRTRTKETRKMPSRRARRNRRGIASPKLYFFEYQDEDYCIKAYSYSQAEFILKLEIIRKIGLLLFDSSTIKLKQIQPLLQTENCPICFYATTERYCPNCNTDLMYPPKNLEHLAPAA